MRRRLEPVLEPAPIPAGGAAAALPGAALKGQKRVRLLILTFLACFLVIAARLGELTLAPAPREVTAASPEHGYHMPRPDIVDRRGQVLATEISVASLFADPRKIVDVDEAIELLTAVLPALDTEDLRLKLSSNRAFVWLKREVNPEQQARIFDLGLPGLGFRNETRRIYPMGRLGAHVLGFVDVDSRGLAGIEKYLDEKGRLFVASLDEPGRQEPQPVELSLDVRLQHALTDEIAAAMERFKAQAAAGVVLDVHTGEILALVSLPDYNPNDPREALDPSRMNRVTGGVFEMGSSFKTVTFAMALDAGVTDLDGRYDARVPLIVGRSRVDDYHATRRILTVPEVFTHSSNIGTAKMALEVGLDAHQAFLRKLGFLDRLRTEIAEAAAPLLPLRWGRATTITAAFGHGVSVQPLQLAAAAAAFVNGGKLVEPTVLKRDAAAIASYTRQVIRPETSRKMRYLFRLNVEEGTARKADVPGYRVGGKTGSAEKVVGRRYSRSHRLTSFLGSFPMDDPKYAILVMLDEPQPLPETSGYATAGWNAVPTAGRLIGRIAPMLGVEAKPDDSSEARARQAKAGTGGD